jgi:hypothetical protein
MGLLFFILFVTNALHLQFEGLRRFFLGLSMLFGGIASAFFLTILDHLHLSGHRVGFWRTAWKDFELYSEYWRTAPTKGWPRWYLSAAIAATMISAVSMVAAVVVRHGK